MKKMFISIIICILIISILFPNWNIDLNAKNVDNEMDSNSTLRSYELPRTGGFDWGAIEVISEPIPDGNININDSVYPAIAVKEDKIYVVWSDSTDLNGAGGDADIFFRYFDGNKWSEIQVISEPVPGQNFNTRLSSCPAIAVENGKIYVVWYDENNTNGAGTDSDIFYRCNPTGSNWEPIQVISEPVVGSNINNRGSGNPKIEVENNNIYVVWFDYTNIDGCGEEGDIFYRCNLTGFSWESIQIISEPVPGFNYNIGGFEPDIAVENGKIFVVWTSENDTDKAGKDGDIFYRCNLSGSNWESIQVISEPVKGHNINIGYSDSPKIAVENGKIYVVWYDYNNTNGAGTDTDIFYICNITGFGWEEVQVISEPVSGQDFNIGESLYPEIAVEYNKIYVVWHDFNNTNGASGDFDIFYICNITGYSWESVQVISEPVEGTNFNSLDSIRSDIFINRGISHIIWQDSNDTNGAGTDWDIFYRPISLTMVIHSPIVTPTLGNTNTNFNFTITYIHFDNKSPTKIIVNISGTEYSMLEVDPLDINYMDGNNYFFNIENLDIGVHKYQFYAFDSTISVFTRLFNLPIVYNTQPKITIEDNLTAFEDVKYEIDYNYEDIDVKNVGQVVTWNFSTDAEWLTFNKSTTILNGTPTNDNVGKYWVNISIDDTMDSDFTNFTLTVVNINDAPIITTNNINIINEDNFYEVEYQAVDVDSPQDSLFWNLQTNASWLGFEQSTATLSGMPENDDVGVYWINISVSDTEYIDFSNFTLKVLNVNDPPKIITKDNTTALEDKFYEMIYQAEDVDNTPDELIWNINTNAKWLNYDIPTAVINGTPTNDNVGKYWVNISVSDNEFIDFTNFTLTVLNTNDPPMIITKDKTNATAGEIYSINYDADDIDPPPITLSWSVNTNTSDWLTIDTYNGWLNGIPSEKDVGIYWVNVTVTDGESGWDFHNFTLKVLKKPVQLNYAPQLFNASMTPSEGDIETVFTLSVRYFDEDGNNPEFIQLVIDDAAYNMKLKPGENPSNGTYEHSVTLSEGPHLYFFIAFDGFETVRTNYFTTPYIKDIDKISTEEISWFWLFLVVIVIIIIVVLILMLVLKKRKAIKLPTVQAEMLRAPPAPIALPSATLSVDIAAPLAARAIVSEQLPSPKVQVQPSVTTPTETISTLSLAPTTIETQFQLPKATLSRTQKLELLEERFLRGEVDLETYKELKNKIETHTGEDITKDESEDQPTIINQEKYEPIEEATKIKTSTDIPTEVVGIPPQQSLIKPEPIKPISQVETPRSIISEPKQTPQELPQIPESKAQQPQPPQDQSQPSTQVKEQPKPIIKEQNNVK